MNADDRIARRAAEWIARRDRGLTAGDQAAYLDWLRASPAHEAAIARHEAAFHRLLQLRALAGAAAEDPVFDGRTESGPPRRMPSLAAIAALTAVAAAVVAAIVGRQLLHRPAPLSDLAADSCLKLSHRQTLADGSVVVLKDGAQIDLRYSAAERRVVLRQGEAFFTVVHNPLRPFVVEAASVVVTDVGTVFDVDVRRQTVAVLVTEGRVSLNRSQKLEVVAGERAVVPVATDAPATVQPTAPVEREELLSWQKPRFEFSATPLPVAVAEFNRRSAAGTGPKLVVGDSSLDKVRIGGTLRADDIEGFVRLLGTTEGIRTERRASGEIVLRAGR